MLLLDDERTRPAIPPECPGRAEQLHGHRHEQCQPQMVRRSAPRSISSVSMIYLCIAGKQRDVPALVLGDDSTAQQHSHRLVQLGQIGPRVGPEDDQIGRGAFLQTGQAQPFAGAP